MAETVVARGRAMAVLIWTLRVLLAVLFFYLGWIKFPADSRPWVRIFELIGFGQWFRIVTAIVE